MNKQLIRFPLFLLMYLTLLLTAMAQVVDLPDPNLRAAIEKALGKAPGTTITATEMATLTRLEARNANISDLTGLEAATNLKSLWLDGEEVAAGTWRNSNLVSDLSPLAGLTNLTELLLDDNNITDISPLSGLTNLTNLGLSINNITNILPLVDLTNLEVLGLWRNSVSDLSPLAGLTNLIELYLGANPASDLSPLAGLTNLESLFLDEHGISNLSALAGLTNLTRLALNNNLISDLSPLAGLTNLRWMRLAGNNISDLSPLVVNTGLGNGDEINVRANPLNYTSIKTHIPVLQSRGVTVEFDNRTPMTLLNISGVITELDNLLIVEVRDSNGLVFEGVPVMFTVTSGSGTLSATRTTTDADGRAESRLTLGSDGGSNTVRANVEGIFEPVTFSNVAVNIPDPNLRAAVEIALGKVKGKPIAPSEMAALTHLEARNANISDLTGLEHATHLTRLELVGNNIGDVSVLTGLTKLTSLFLDNNRISDLSPLAGLTNLRWMRLAGNNISDLSPLVVNTGLGSGDEINVRANPLNYTSIKTHIPALKNRGVTVEFDDVTHLNFGEPRMVRLIYFLPSDRSSQQNIDIKLDTLIRDIQQFYADEMEHHNFGRKIFTFETDATGKAVVHHVDGQFTDSYYRQNSFHKVWEEIREQFYTPQNIYFIAIDIGNERVGRGYNEVCGVGDSHGASGGHVLIPASGDCFNLKTAAHELGHTFGLQHDFRSDTYIMSFGRTPNKLSECAAEWLDVHRYFNVNQNQPHFDSPTTIQMLSPLASPPYAIDLRFEVTDPDGIHQAQLLTPATIRNQGLWQPKFLSCKRLNGETDTIAIEFNTNQLTVKSSEVTLSVIDAYGRGWVSQYHIADVPH